LTKNSPSAKRERNFFSNFPLFYLLKAILLWVHKGIAKWAVNVALFGQEGRYLKDGMTGRILEVKAIVIGIISTAEERKGDDF
jgi:hypothetical protein